MVYELFTGENKISGGQLLVRYKSRKKRAEVDAFFRQWETGMREQGGFTMKRKAISVVLAGSLAAGLLSGCGQLTGNGTKTADSEEQGSQKYEEFLTVDVFDAQANFQGIQSGWFGQIVKEKFNMELNIIAPNVTGGGDTLFQTRFASGDIGDLIITGAQNGRLQSLVTAELVLDMTELLADAQYIHRYDSAIAKTSEFVDEEGIYAIPSEVSSNAPTSSSEGLEPNYGAYLRWDVYGEIGYPQVDTLEDLIPVLQKMQEAMPKSDSGEKTYAISLFKDWDGNMMTTAKPFASLYGYDEIGFVLAKADGSDYDSLIDSDSSYVRALHFLFEANQLGLVDPESVTQDYDTLFQKYQDGQILFSMYSWLGPSAYNTEENKAAGKGFMLVPIADQTIFSYGCQINGNANNQCIMIGSRAEDPQRLADFIDWLYSPEGVVCSSYLIGPEGLTWEIQDGAPVLTEFGKKALYEIKTELPDEWGKGIWQDGVSQLNFKAVNWLDVNPDTGVCYNYAMWDSVIEEDTSAFVTDWQEFTGAKTTMEYLTEHGQVIVAPGSGYVAQSESTQIAALRRQCSSNIVDYSWRMVFAKDEAEFEALLAELQNTVERLGYEQVLEYDMKCALEQNEARETVVEEYEAGQ